jgi:lipopolysaccharide export system protein LptA
LAFESCIANKRLIPEKASNPELQGIYKITSKKNIINPQKYETGENVVKSEIGPGNTVSMSPDPAIHKISKSEQDLSKKYSDPSENLSAAEKKKSGSHVIYTGNELLRNNEIIKKTGREDIVTTIRGAAAVRYEQMLMKSFEIRVEGAAGNNIISDYPVFFYDYKSNTTLNAGFGEFIRSENRAYFTKKPFVTHNDKKTGEKTTIEGDEMDRYFSSSITRAYGHVIIKYPGAVAYATRAIYFEADDRVELMGNPVIYEKKNIYKADKIIIYKKTSIAVLDDNVRVLLTQEKKNTSDTREVETLITGDYAEYRYRELTKTSEFKSKRKNSFVYVSRKDTDTYCGHLMARGEQLEEMELFENIYILDKENRTRLFGEYGNYSKKDHRSKVFTRDDPQGNAVHPILVFYNKDDVITGKMTSEILDRDLEKKTTWARGNVEFELYEKTANPDLTPEIKNQAHGEWSEMEDQNKAIFILGNPYLQNNQSKIFAAQIVIYPDENRLELLNSLKGIFSN